MCNFCNQLSVYKFIFNKISLFLYYFISFFLFNLFLSIFIQSYGFTTTYAISAYHHWLCELESRSGRGVQHYVIKFVSDLRQVGDFLRLLRLLPPIKLTVHDITEILLESGVKRHQTNKQANQNREQILIIHCLPCWDDPNI